MKVREINAELPMVSLVMPVRNEGQFLQQSLQAVLGQDYPSNRLEIIIAEGGSTDDTRNIARSFQQRFSNVRCVDNPGLIVATGLNAALKESTGTIVIRVDGHCKIASDYVRRCVEHLEKRNLEAVGGPIETIGRTFISQSIAVAMSSRFGVGDSTFRTVKDRECYVDTVPFPAYKKSVIERAGLFDEELVRNQDDEYNYRLRKLGVKILLSPEIRSQYYSRASLASLWRQYLQYGYWKVRVMQKHPQEMRFRQFAPPMFVASLLVCALLASFLPLFSVILLIIGLSYLVTNLLASFSSAAKKGWRYLPLLPLIYAILHLSYGSGFLVGLVRFAGRWKKQEREKL